MIFKRLILFIFLTLYTVIHFQCLPKNYSKTITIGVIDSVLEEFTLARIQYNLFSNEVPTNAELIAKIAAKKGYSVQLFFDTLEKENKPMFEKLLGKVK